MYPNNFRGDFRRRSLHRSHPGYSGSGDVGAHRAILASGQWQAQHLNPENQPSSAASLG